MARQEEKRNIGKKYCTRYRTIQRMETHEENTRHKEKLQKRNYTRGKGDGYIREEMKKGEGKTFENKKTHGRQRNEFCLQSSSRRTVFCSPPTITTATRTAAGKKTTPFKFFQVSHRRCIANVHI